MHKVRGVLHEVVDDEVAMDDDEKGETKVDSQGRLIGCKSFSLSSLSDDPRSSYLTLTLQLNGSTESQLSPCPNVRTRRNSTCSVSTSRKPRVIPIRPC